MNKKSIYLVTLIVSFCSISYELLLAQSMTAFLENTVLRYSVTIGLYLFSMGVGALIVDKNRSFNTVSKLLTVEILLTVIGGFLVIFLHFLDILYLPRTLFIILMNLLVFIIGMFTGFELPLLMSILENYKQRSENVILGFSYIGAFLGTIIFAFVFYQKLGLMGASFFIGFLNSMAGLLLLMQKKLIDANHMKKFYSLLYVQMTLFFILGVFFIYNQGISEFFVIQYLK